MDSRRRMRSAAEALFKRQTAEVGAARDITALCRAAPLD